MRRYETIAILDPDLAEDAHGALCERLTDLIPAHKGLLVELDDWGVRRLAYDIKKKVRGHYVRLDYCGTGSLVDEMERLMRINDGFMKYMTVLQDKYVDLDLIKEQLAAQEAEAAAAEEASKPAETPESEASGKEAAPDEAESKESDTETSEAEKTPVESAPVETATPSNENSKEE